MSLPYKGLAKDPVKAVIYCRISLAIDGNTAKVKRQEKLCRALAKRLGWEVVHVYCDNNKSAWRRDRNRPDWDAMLAAIEQDEIDAVIIYHGDRLIRQPWDLEKLLSLADGRGLRLASPTGTRNLDDADDRYRLRLDVAKACNESDTISRRTRVAHEERALKGKVRKGGARSFGYKRSGKVLESEAAEYRDAVARLLAGESRTSVLKDWKTRGVLTTAGNPWEYTAFSKMLTRPRYAALSVYRGEVVGVGKWPALVEREVWEALQVVLGVGSALYTRGPVGRGSVYLLTNIASCASCGGHLTSHLSAGLTSYRCLGEGCPLKVRRNVGHLDEYVIGAVLALLSDEAMAARLSSSRSDEGAQAAAELAKLEAKRRQAVAAFADDDVVSASDLRTVLSGLDDRIKTVRDRLGKLAGAHVLDGCVGLSREGWDGLPLDRRRSVVRALVRVEVGASKRGRGFDPDSVRVLPA